MRLLVVDDQPESVALAKIAIEGAFKDALVVVEPSFDDAVPRIDSFEPDLIILDLLQQSSTGGFQADGIDPLEAIWNTRFVAIIIYSAQSRLVEERFPSIGQHPLVKLVDKGLDSEENVVNSIQRLMPFIQVLKRTRSAAGTQLSIVLKHVVPQILKTLTVQGNQQIDAISRASYRRLSALADNALDDVGSSWAWERYLVPPITGDLLIGDIMVKAGAPFESVDEYRLILSPSCDLVATETRRPKVKSVLVAKCCSTRDGLRSLAISRRPQDIRRRILSQGFYERMLPLPALVDVVPNMMANLTDLELIPFNDIGDGPGSKFKRVASVSSPFRELVAWAYIQTAGRPGLPETDLDSWANEVVADAKGQ